MGLTSPQQQPSLSNCAQAVRRNATCIPISCARCRASCEWVQRDSYAFVLGTAFSGNRVKGCEGRVCNVDVSRLPADPSRAAALRAHTLHMQQHLQELMQRYLSMCAADAAQGAAEPSSARPATTQGASDGDGLSGRSGTSSEYRMRELQAMLSAAMQVCALAYSVMLLHPCTTVPSRVRQRASSPRALRRARVFLVISVAL